MCQSGQPLTNDESRQVACGRSGNASLDSPALHDSGAAPEPTAARAAEARARVLPAPPMSTPPQVGFSGFQQRRCWNPRRRLRRVGGRERRGSGSGCCSGRPVSLRWYRRNHSRVGLDRDHSLSISCTADDDVDSASGRRLSEATPRFPLSACSMPRGERDPSGRGACRPVTLSRRQWAWFLPQEGWRGRAGTHTQSEDGRGHERDAGTLPGILE
jgi:hypothetical protein